MKDSDVVSLVRFQFIRDIANDEWVDRFIGDWDAREFEGEKKDRQLLEFLASPDTTATELHLFVQTWNWDGGKDEMERVINHPNCDAATALLIYWMGDPDSLAYAASRSSPTRTELDRLQLLRTFELRWSVGFRTSDIAFDPVAAGWYDDGKHEDLPVEYRVAIQGRVVSTSAMWKVLHGKG